jgi:hypothetical protein
MSNSIEKWINKYKHLELDESAIKMFNDVYSKQYDKDINHFKAHYFQTCVDININVLNIGDRVYYVFGTSLNEGIIENIEEYEVGYTIPRIKIEGKKKLIWNYQVVKC